MMRRFAINTATLGFQCPIEKSIEAIASHGFGGIAPWRREVEGNDVKAIAKHIRDAGLKATGYCRSTYLPSLTRDGLQANIESNKRALDDVAILGAESFVMVVGGLPKGSKDIAGLSEALDMCQQIEGSVSEPSLGICLDVYHVWWDPNLKRDIARAGKERRIFGFHVCDWLVPTADILNDRGMMGDGVIDIPSIRAQAEKAGYQGLIEVEIFSDQNWWKRPVAEILKTCASRLATSV